MPLLLDLFVSQCFPYSVSLSDPHSAGTPFLLSTLYLLPSSSVSPLLLLSVLNCIFMCIFIAVLSEELLSSLLSFGFYFYPLSSLMLLLFHNLLLLPRLSHYMFFFYPSLLSSPLFSSCCAFFFPPFIWFAVIPHLSGFLFSLIFLAN
ncbi:hypothetical protein AMECASPLE_029381 [Ameca splendens]|uniref:Uncharacterized protein n=1 Tax=Ameca splendens TaxID=208324 RepID=A0ABV0YGV8_9TELE